MFEDWSKEDREKLYMLAAIATILGVLFTVGGRMWSWIGNYHQSLSQIGIPFPAPTLILITTIVFPSYLALKLMERIIKNGDYDD